MNTYPHYSSIETLFILRNNISHGRNYTEEVRREMSNTQSFAKSITNSNYEKVRNFLLNKRLIKPNEDTLNSGGFWESSVVHFFYQEVRLFVIELINSVEFNKKQDMMNEVEKAYGGCL